MDRQLLDYLPPVLAEEARFRAVTASEQPEIETLWEEQENVLNEQFVSTASAAALSRWEAFLRLPSSGDTESRRRAVTERLREQPPFTYSTLAQALSALCGAGNIDLTLSLGQYSLWLRVTPLSPMSEVRSLLTRMLPANIALDLDYLYMSHLRVANMRHNELSAFTHGIIRNMSDT